jgi:hypothetical protein
LYGISQNPDTNNYILVQNNILNLINWMSGNKKIDNLIQEMQLRVDSNFNIIFEWIPYNQFNYIKEIGNGGFATVYSTIWKNGPLKYDANKKIYTRVPNKKIALKCLNNLQNVTDKFLNEV